MRAILGTTVAAVLLSLSVVAAATDGGRVATDGGHPRDAGPPETPGQKVYRNAYISKTIKREVEVTKGHVWTPDVGALENLHWHRAYRALRMRELAEDEKDTAAVARVDTDIVKLDQHFFTTLATLSAAAPSIPPAPTLASPASGASLAVGTAVTLKINPVPGATHYYCLLWGGGRHMWSNYDPTTKQYGTSPECTIPANDPKWAKFESGKANVLIRAISPAKTPSGVAYTITSHTAQIPVVITGGATPTTASSAKAVTK
jgi:hypothetical protein